MSGTLGLPFNVEFFAAQKDPGLKQAQPYIFEHHMEESLNAFSNMIPMANFIFKNKI